MYAIVDIKDKQFKVRENDTLYVPRHDNDADDTLMLDRVLLVSDGEGNATIGTPTVAGATVEATVLDHVKGDKVLVFKKKRRKRYRVKNGHRQQYTQIRIDALNTNSSSKKKSKKKKPSKADEAQTKAAEAEAQAAQAEAAEAEAEAKEAEAAEASASSEAAEAEAADQDKASKSKASKKAKSEKDESTSDE